MAIKHANARDATIVSEFASLQKTYTAVSTDSGTSEAGTIAAYRSCVAAGVKGIVGPALSRTNVIAGYVGGLDQIVNMGYWTSSPTLTDSVTFPYLATRSYHSDTVRASKLIETFNLFNLTNFGIINTDDAWANAFVSLIRLAAEEPGSGVNVINSFNFAYGNAEAVRTAVRRLHQLTTPVNVIFTLTFDNDLEVRCDEAANRGLFSSEYVWIEAQGLSTQPLAAAQNASVVGPRINGWLQIASILPASNYAKYESAWAGMTAADCNNPVFTPSPSLFGGPPVDVGSYEYDAAAAMILALDSLTVAQESDGDVVRAAVGALDFQGASGRMKFEASLDRDVTTADISLFNLTLPRKIAILIAIHAI